MVTNTWCVGLCVWAGPGGGAGGGAGIPRFMELHHSSTRAQPIRPWGGEVAVGPGGLRGRLRMNRCRAPLPKQ